MPERAFRRPAVFRRITAVWYALAALATVLAALALWLAPRRIEGIATLDPPMAGHRWSQRAAPLVREIVWGPPEPLRGLFAPADGAEPPASLEGAHLADGGATLYVTVRRPGEDADIYRSRWTDGRWETAAPVMEWITPADDLGPVASPDGRYLYFCSNRPGGQGGLDLYVSQRIGSAWSVPENLGPQINGPGHDCDPALSPDGLRLFFASDRSGAPAEPSGQGEGAAARGRPARERPEPRFDLYLSRRESAEQVWSAPVALAAANEPAANERAPFVAPNGSFLYFASDRPARPHEPANLDLYRVRLAAGGAAGVESLGPGINTAADETEPLLSPEGFTLVFSSDRHARGKASRLHRSTAAEVEHLVAWDTSHWEALGAIWWKAGLATLLLMGLLAVIWCAKGWLFEPALGGSLARFFAASLLIHAAVLWLVLLIPLGQEIYQRVEEIRVSQAATQMFDDNLHQSHEAGQEAYEKVADLRSVEAVSLSAVNRQITTAPNVPVASEMPAPTLPAEFARRLPPNRLLFVPPAREEPPAVPPEVERGLRADPLRAAVPPPLDAEPPPAVEMPAEPPLDQEVQIARVEPAAPAPTSAPPSREALLVRVARAGTDVEAARSQRITIPEAAPAPREVRRAPLPSARDQLSAEAEMPTIAGHAVVESPLPLANTIAGRMSESQPSPRKVETVPARLATARAAGPLAAADVVEPGAGQTTAAPAVARRERTVVSPPAEKPEEVLLVAATKAPGMPEMAVEGAALIVERRNEAGPAPERRLPAEGRMAASVGLPRPEGMQERLRPDKSAAEAAPQAADVRLARAEVTRKITAEQVPGELIPMPEAVMSPTATPLAGAPLVMPRQEALVLELAAETPGEFGGPRDALEQKVVIGSVAEEAVDAPPSLAPLATQLARRPARATPVAYAEDNVGMRGMFALRQGDVRREFIDLFGGSEESESAVRLGLNWLAQHQHQDGRWSLHQLDPPEKNLPASTGPGSVASDTAGTGFGLLPFLGSGYTHTSGDYQATVAQAVKWLVEHQKPDGDLFVGPSSNAHMYSHGIAAIALSEAYGLTEDPLLREPAQRALNFIVAAQHQGTGGWRYTPGEPGDTSVVGWEVMALKSGEMAGLAVPQSSLDLAARWLASVEGQGGAIGTFGYQGPGGSLAMTAEGLLCRQFLGGRRDEPGMQNGAKYLLANLPQQGRETSYYWYYATQVMYHMQGEYWTAWNSSLGGTVVAAQIKDGPLAGTWHPQDQWEQSGGRIYATSLRLLILQVYYRHLPLYRQLAD